MTHIAKAPHDETERAKWRVHADLAAAHLKGMKDFGGKETHLAAFIFDDGVVKLPLAVALIQKLSEQALADWIFETVLDAQNAAQAPGEVNPGNGREQENASPAPDTTPVAAEPCMRRLEPDFTKPCPNHATGALRVTLRPSPAVSKRWGMHSMLTFVMDMPVCSSCFPKVGVFEITDQPLRAAIGKKAQQMNSGVLVDWKQTLIEHVPFDDQHLVALRASMATKAANDSQPGPAAPQREGAGDGEEHDGPGGRAA